MRYFGLMHDAKITSLSVNSIELVLLTWEGIITYSAAWLAIFIKTALSTSNFFIGIIGGML